VTSVRRIPGGVNLIVGANPVTAEKLQSANAWRMNFSGIAVILIVVACGIGGFAFFSLKRPRPGALRYRARGPFMTRQEREFSSLLEAAIGGRYRIGSKISLAHLIEPKTPDGADVSSDHTARLREFTIDFVVCDNETCEVLAAIQLDRRSSLSERPFRAEAFIRDALLSANIHLLALSPRKQFTAAELASEIESALCKDFVQTLTLTSTDPNIQVVQPSRRANP
jgi:hypothetical protein